MRGEYSIDITRPDGSQFRIKESNLIPRVAMRAFGLRILGGLEDGETDPYSPPTKLALGSGTAAPTADDIALQTQVTVENLAVINSQILVDDSGFVISAIVGAFTYTGALFTLSEMGVIGDAVGHLPVLYSRSVTTTPTPIPTNTVLTPVWSVFFEER